MGVEPGIYRHFKGKKYRVLGTALHSETSEELIVYMPMYEGSSSKYWVRPIAMFESSVTVKNQKTQADEQVPRFKLTKKSRGGEKGGEFERLVCKKLSEWISGGKRDDLLSRNVQSGGQYTSAVKRGKARGTPGDIVSRDPLSFDFASKFVVECKHWKDLDLQSFIVQGKGELFDALIKVQKQAKEMKKHWMMVVRQNNKPTLILLPFEVQIQLKCFLGLALREGAYGMYFDIFLKEITYEKFIVVNCPSYSDSGETTSHAEGTS